MRTFSQHRVALCRVPALFFACLAAVAVLSAQTPAPAAHPVHHRKPRPAVSKSKTAPSPALVEIPKPNWPANNQPAPASVSWDQSSLRIDASNSSLDQILAQITSATGAKIEGVGGDQRIFGVFGPGRARDVLGELLQGSGYNVVMVGDNGHGLPREVLLSDRNAAGSAPPAAHPPQPQDDDFEDAPDTSQVDTTPQPPIQPVQPLETQPRTPQEMQEQQLMRQPGQPGQPPPQQPQ